MLFVSVNSFFFFFSSGSVYSRKGQGSKREGCYNKNFLVLSDCVKLNV